VPSTLPAGPDNGRVPVRARSGPACGRSMVPRSR
jgi:hypothetical protein